MLHYYLAGQSRYQSTYLHNKIKILGGDKYTFVSLTLKNTHQFCYDNFCPKNVPISWSLLPTITILKKPKSLKHTEASAIPFIGLTAWSSLMISAGLSSEKLNRNAKFKILIIGASGGVGTFAVQLLKALNYR